MITPDVCNLRAFLLALPAIQALVTTVHHKKEVFYSYLLQLKAMLAQLLLHMSDHRMSPEKLWGYSSVVEHLTADQEVPRSTLGAPWC